MKKLNILYNLLNNIELFNPEPTPDWRIKALEYLEPDVQLFAWRYKITGMDRIDVEQELRIHLWDNLENFDPNKSGIRTWAWKVIYNKVWKLNRYSRQIKRYAIVLPLLEHDKPIEILDGLNVDDHLDFLRILFL